MLCCKILYILFKDLINFHQHLFALKSALVVINNKHNFRGISLFLKANEEEGDRLFSVVPSHSTGGNRYELKHVTVPLNMRKSFIYQEGYQKLEQVAQRGFAVSICGVTKNLAQHIPGQPALGVPA